MWQDLGETNVTDKNLQTKWLTDVELIKIETRHKQAGSTESMVAENTTNIMDEVAVSQSEVVSQNIQSEPADIKLVTEKKKGLVIKIKALGVELAMRRDIITTMRNAPKKQVMEEVDKIGKIIEHTPLHNITKLDDSIYVRLVIVAQRLNRKQRDCQEPE